MNRETVYVAVFALAFASTIVHVHVGGFVVREGEFDTHHASSVGKRDTTLGCGVTDLANGSVTKGLYGGVILIYTFTCKDGYHPEGFASLVCIADKLHGYMPVCVETALSFVDNNCTVNLSSSEVCDHICGGGDYCKIKPGNLVRCCRMKRIVFSSFAGKQNRCSESCDLPPKQPPTKPTTPPKPQTTTKPETSPDTTTPAKAQADPPSTTTPTQQDGEGKQTEAPLVSTPDKPEATPTKPTDCDVTAPTNGDVEKQVDGNVVKYVFTCRSDYHLDGSPSLSCINGKLDGNPPVCEVTVQSYTNEENNCTATLSASEVCTASCAAAEYCRKKSGGVRCCRQQRITFVSFAGEVDRCSETCVLPLAPTPRR